MKTLYNYLFVAVPRLANGVLSLTLQLVLIHHLNPDHFGVFSLCIAGILVADSVLGSPFDMGILRLMPGRTLVRQELDEPEEIERVALRLKIKWGVVALVICTIFSAPISAKLFELPNTWQLIPICGIAVLSTMFLRSVLVHLQAKERFASYGTTDLIHILTKYGGVALLVMLTRPTLDALLFFFVAGPLFASVIFRRHLSLRLLSHPREEDINGIEELYSFIGWYTATSILGLAVMRLDLFMLGWISPSSDVGIFSGGQLLASVPWILGSHFGIVLTPRITPMCREGTFFKFFCRIQIALIGLAIGTLILTYLFWPKLSTTVLPDKFSDSGTIFLILLPGTLGAMVTFPLSLTLVMFTRRHFLIAMNCVAVPLLMGAYGFAIPRYGAEGAAYVTSGMTLIQTFLVNGLAWHLASKPKSLFAESDVANRNGF